MIRLFRLEIWIWNNISEDYEIISEDYRIISEGYANIPKVSIQQHALKGQKLQPRVTPWV